MKGTKTKTQPMTEFEKDEIIATWGGKRKGAGRPEKEPTKTLSYRVPEKLAEKIDAAIRNVINKIRKR